jgi:Undecaprenyl-phosphate galactose phosphotransferase WbaP
MPVNSNDLKASLPLRSRLKRSIDICGALCGLFFLSPLMLLITILVRRDGGSAFFGHHRIGCHGKVFQCWKFRSMAVNADVLLKELLEQSAEARAEWEQDFKLRDDPRITRVGHFLRTISLDELPQLWNVLLGDMSLVGPRPIVEAERHYYGSAWDDYTSVRPGMTGLWQVSGRNDTGYAQRVALDSQYIRQWSVMGDLDIMLRTVRVVLGRSGAY